ncbi:hypothetical protein [Nostoc sp. CALU 546]|uniref:hypothetical protein n=1 Tax=unclassified Nostoc TaxID=2593658 RepID=UPI003B675E7A
MSTDKFIKLDILDKMNLNLLPSINAKLMIVNHAVTKPDLTRPEGAITHDEALFFTPLCSMIFLAIFIFKLLDAWKIAGEKFTTVNCFHQLPCRNCRFFTNNHYLYCTVHPSIVLTEQALDCSDYCPLSENLE